MGRSSVSTAARRVWAEAGAVAAAVLVAIPVAATLACLMLAGFAVQQGFSGLDAGWRQFGWAAFALLMSAAPWVTPKPGNGWAMVCMTAMGAGGLWFAWRRLGVSGPLACRPADALCGIAEGVRLSAGEHALVALFGLAGLGLVIGGLRYMLAARQSG